MTENDKETFKSYRYIRILRITELRLKGKLLSVASMKSANKKRLIDIDRNLYFQKYRM